MRKIINTLEGERPISFKCMWGLMRCSETCFGNQTAGKVTENENLQRRLTSIPQSTGLGAQEVTERRPEPLFVAYVY